MSTVVTLTVNVCIGRRHVALSEAEMQTIGDEIFECLMEDLQPEAGEVAWVTAEATEQFTNAKKEDK